MPAWALKMSATLLTLLAAVGSAAYVGAHLKSPSAPLHPTVVAGGGGHQLAFFSIGDPSPRPAQAATGNLHISASVQVAGPEAALTYTSVS